MSTLNEAVIPFPCAPQNKPSPPRARRPVGAVLHWMVGYLPGTDGMFRNPATGYATNLGIGSLDGENYVIHEYVPEGEVAWGNGNDHLNAAAISIEHENNRAGGPTSKPTPEVHELSARYLAAAARRWDWRIGGKLQLVLRDFPNHDFYEETVPGFGTEFNVTGHRTVALKDCPNLLDMGWIVARGNEILAGGGASKEIKVKHINYQDRRVRSLTPGQSVVLGNAKGQDQDVTGGLTGPFSFTPHVYADGAPGDVVELRLEWRNRKTGAASPSYTERLEIDGSGQVRASRQFQRDAVDAVVVRVLAPASNSAPVSVSVLDIDTFLFAVA